MAPVQLVFPPTLSAKQRAMMHDIAEQLGIDHGSAGEGAARHITMGRGRCADATSVHSVNWVSLCAFILVGSPDLCTLSAWPALPTVHHTLAAVAVPCQ